MAQFEIWGHGEKVQRFTTDFRQAWEAWFKKRRDEKRLLKISFLAPNGIAAMGASMISLFMRNVKVYKNAGEYETALRTVAT
jgi:hypothetical protein